MELLNTDIKELEIANYLRRFGNIQVMDWDFRTVLPALKNIANREVDVIDSLKRAAHYKVMDWDFRKPFPHESDAPAKPARKSPDGPETQAIIGRLKKFLQYVTVNLIDEPANAQIRVAEIAPGVLRFRLLLVKRDAAMLIGMEGHTASAIRGIMKAVGGTYGVHVLLEIVSHE